MPTQDDFKTPDELLATLGERVRALRLSQNKRMADVAKDCGVALPAIARLERGKGSSVRTLVSVLAALGQASRGIDLLAPQVSVSPMAMLARGNRPPRRASRANQ